LRRRYDNWKITFLKQEAEGLKGWQQPFTPLRAPALANLRMDPFERAEQEHAMGYQRWYFEHMFVIAPAGAYVGQWLQSFKEFPPRQKPGTFNLDRVMEAVIAGSNQQRSRTKGRTMSGRLRCRAGGRTLSGVDAAGGT
jgi:arylsulfatase